MNLTHPSEVRQLLAELNFRPSRALGQNFLIDGNILRLILQLARVEKRDTVLEIGPGLGVLTKALLERAGQVIAIEKDRRLAAYLGRELAGAANLRLIEGDALDAGLTGILAGGVTKVISNLPYSVGSRILIELTEADPPPKYALVTVQKEVANRLAAKPDTADYGLLTVLMQVHYDVVVDRVVSPNCFFPAPQVKSALVELFRRTEPRLEPSHLPVFRRLAKTAFDYRRKQMATIFQRRLHGPVEVLSAAGIDPGARPETVSVDQWCALARLLSESA
jgi:16S rRNA (adenine1518-N6/adenine1519-N6)-dimethyltransferase